MPELKQTNDAELQKSSVKETSHQLPESDTDPFLGNQTTNTGVHWLNESQENEAKILQNAVDAAANHSGDVNTSPRKLTASQIEERLVSDQTTNELYMPLSCTIVLKRNKEMLYVPLDFENGITIDALVKSKVYVSAIAWIEMDRIKQQNHVSIFKIDHPPDFQIHVANGLLERLIALAAFNFDIRDHTFAEHLVVMNNLTGLNIGLHFMRHNSVVDDTTRGAATEKSAKPQAVFFS